MLHLTYSNRFISRPTPIRWLLHSILWTESLWFISLPLLKLICYSGYIDVSSLRVGSRLADYHESMNEVIIYRHRVVIGVVFCLSSAVLGRLVKLLLSRCGHVDLDQSSGSVVAPSAPKTALWNLAVRQSYSVSVLPTGPLYLVGEDAHSVTLSLMVFPPTSPHLDVACSITPKLSTAPLLPFSHWLCAEQLPIVTLLASVHCILVRYLTQQWRIIVPISPSGVNTSP